MAISQISEKIKDDINKKVRDEIIMYTWKQASLHKFFCRLRIHLTLFETYKF